MSKWNRWKLIHKETELTFNQYYKKYKIKDNNGEYQDYKMEYYKLIPVMLTSGVPAVYVDMDYYPYMFFLDNKEWRIEMKNKTENNITEDT